jgi:hypothetical protein
MYCTYIHMYVRTTYILKNIGRLQSYQARIKLKKFNVQLNDVSLRFLNIFIAKPAEANSLLKHLAVYMTGWLYCTLTNQTGQFTFKKYLYIRMFNVCSEMSSNCISGLPVLIMVCI